jgi:TolA-binding protein
MGSGSIVGAGLNGETSLDYKLGGPYRIETGMGIVSSGGKSYYPFLFRPSYSFGLFPFIPAGDWKYFQFGLGLTGGLFNVGGRIVPIPFPSLLIRVGAEDSIYAFLDAGDVPYTSGGIGGGALGLGWGITPSTRIALMAGASSLTDILDLNVTTSSTYPELKPRLIPMALLSWEQGLAGLDQFVGGIGLLENIALQLSGGVSFSGLGERAIPTVSPAMALGLSYRAEFPSSDVGASELMVEAQRLEGEGRWEEAGITYRKIISRYPDNRWIDEAVYRNALSYEKLGRSDEALREYSHLATTYPASRWNALAQYALGARAVRDARWDEVYKSFTNVLNSQPGSEAARRASYWAEYSLANLEDRERAKILLEEFLAYFPDVELSDDALFRLGEAYFEEGRYQEAAGRYSRVVERYPKSDKAAPAQLMIGRSLHLSQEPGRAEEEYRKVIENYPDRQDLVREAQAELDKLRSEMGE